MQRCINETTADVSEAIAFMKCLTAPLTYYLFYFLRLLLGIQRGICVEIFFFNASRHQE